MIRYLVIGYWLFLCSPSLCILVLDKTPTSCSIRKKDFWSKEWRAINKKKNVEVIFNPCEPLPESICGKNKQVCIKHNNTLVFSGNKFDGEDGKISLTSNSSCSLTLLSECAEYMQVEPTVQEISSCIYEVKMRSTDCNIRPCTFWLNDQLIDLGPLRGKQLVHSKNFTFSIDVCDTNPDCGNFKASVCDITDEKNIIPLSLTSTTEHFRYNKELSQIEKHGKFKGKIPGIGRSVSKIFELTIKCDWRSTSKIHYKEVQTQGKTFKFEMASPYACIKGPPNCVVHDKFYTFNLTKLHNSLDNWKVRNVKKGQIVLNMCGPLQPMQPVENNCTGSFSQVCEINENGYINRGSIQTDLTVENNIITTTFISGDTCKGDETYSTHIEFKCSETEENPFLNTVLNRSVDCRIFLDWNTPAACPIINKESCKNISPVFVNTTLETTDKIYDLSMLYKNNSKYTLEDEGVEYMFNIGGPIVDDDSPCMKNMMVALKNLTEYDIRHKVKSLGQMKPLYENDKGQLVVETDGGYYSMENQNYYRSTIFFECCKKNVCEEPIKLLSKTTSTFNFTWKTPAACPKLKPRTRCRFKQPFSDQYSYDFTTLSRTDLKLNVSGSVYLFDICQHNVSKCKEKDCTYVPVDKSLVIYGNKTHLEFSLNKTCNDPQQFNKALFELVCDKIINNDHFEFKSLENCTLLFQLKTHQACSEKDIFVPLKREKSKIIPEYSVHSMDSPNGHSVDTATKTKDPQTNEKEVVRNRGDIRRNLKNCSVENHETGFEFNISSLKLNISSPECPEIVFNYPNKSVVLLFSLDNACESSKIYEYKVIMECPSDLIRQNNTKEKCLETFTTQLPEACKLLEKTILNNKQFSSGEIAGITVGTVAAVLALIGVSILIFLKYPNFGRKSYNSIVYEKDADL
ncbi:lysosomal enzyme receptor protein isoform X2 [Leptinotarsa decemlineata]|uniref:lysosomal enzyme receptor protein isoform X2 n=1 Tax=Leptinotarsa decemlineata TaxID=7539 RepID=UPI003D30B253